MNVLLFGASGMIGQGALRECLLDPEVANVLSVGRSGTGKQHPKLTKIIHNDLLDLAAIEEQLSGYDACIFCLGVSSAGMSEEKYRAITYDITMSIARTLVKLNPQMTFLYVTGMGTDSTEQGRSMWARVKGKTENDLLKMPFKGAYMFRPGAILPKHGVKSKTKLYQFFYVILKPLYPLMERMKSVTTSDNLAWAMVKVAKHGHDKAIIDSEEINRIALNR
ncbi:NAD-dependent epimerase/dehydratase family protein [Paenibacillus sp. YIM B09110]|uniref:NAD-dependent epimerase/dehydratase family protein n=1 Tax=Paenibacillus sp. YIM B09110 TaxID=3126102 RepID=UPI00301E3477